MHHAGNGSNDPLRVRSRRPSQNVPSNKPLALQDLRRPEEGSQQACPPRTPHPRRCPAPDPDTVPVTLRSTTSCNTHLSAKGAQERKKNALAMEQTRCGRQDCLTHPRASSCGIDVCQCNGTAAPHPAHRNYRVPQRPNDIVHHLGFYLHLLFTVLVNDPDLVACTPSIRKK